MNTDLLQRMLLTSVSEQRFFGVVIGIVTNNRDPENLHRVKVRFPWLDTDNESNWARVASPMAGKGRGAYFLPEVDDEVLVAFEHGSAESPYVIGSLWNPKDTAPESNSDGHNNNRTLQSRSGHVIRLGDKAGSETIEVIDKSGKNKIVISTSNNSVTIEAQSDINITSNTGKLTMSAVGVEINSKANVKITATGMGDVNADGILSLKGSLVKVN